MEEEFEASGGEWREYNLENLFGKSTRGKRLKSSDRIVGNLPFVTAGEENTGISAFIGNDVEVFKANSITIDMFGSAKFRGYDFGADDHVAVVHTECLSKKVCQFIATAIHKSSYSGKFSYSRNFYAKDADELNISLPTLNNKIAFLYMENYIEALEAERIETLEAERIETLEAYLTVTNLRDYHLTKNDEKILDRFDKLNDTKSRVEEWEYCVINKLFTKLELKCHRANFDKLRDTSQKPTKEFDLPLVNAKIGGNGIMFYGRTEDFDSAEMTIDIISNGAVATGTVYPQVHRVGVLWDAYLIKSKLNVTESQLKFMATSIQKSIKQRFGWENKAVWSKVQKECIQLPTQNGQIDYQFMSDFIKVIEKLVIKDLVQWTDKKIAAAKEIVAK